jgi:dGTPase
MPATVEGRIVRFADIMAYLNHDLDDAIRSGVIKRAQVPGACVEILGNTHSERIRSMMNDLVVSSRVENGEMSLALSPEVTEAMAAVRQFLYDNVYRSEQVHRQFVKAKKILSELYFYLLENEAVFAKELKRMEMGGFPPGTDLKQCVCDFVASMTDRYALNLYEEIFFPTPMV